MRKKLIHIIPMLFFLVICFGCISFGNTSSISGPDSVDLHAGSPGIVSYNISSPYGSTYFTIKNISPEILIYFDMKESARIDYSGKSIYIVGYKPGTYTFTVNSTILGETVSKVVTVNVHPGKEMCIYGYIRSCSTNKTFGVYLENHSQNPITILPDKAKARHTSYTVFNRSLTTVSKKAIKIKPGRSKTVYFRYKGKRTWMDPKTFVIECQCKYQNKTYKMQVYWANYSFMTADYTASNLSVGRVLVKIKGNWVNTMLCDPSFIQFL